MQQHHNPRPNPQIAILIGLSLLCATPPIAAQDRADGGVAGAIADAGDTSPPTAELGGPEFIGNAITYQAQVKQSGVLIDGLCDLQFSLWNALSGPTQVGSTISQLNQNVNEGVVTVDLNFGAGAFDGNDRWLQVAVRFPAGSGSYQTLTPRQKINAAPYALWSASGAGGGGFSLPYQADFLSNAVPLFFLTNTGQAGGILGLGGAFGVEGRGYSLNGAGVIGRYQGAGNYGSLGTASAGVYGNAIPPHAFTGAVFGEVPANASTEASAVRGINHCPWGYGVYGTHEGNGYGVFGITYTNGRGVYGQGNGSGSEGVRGLNVPQNTLGILGYSGSGVYGEHGPTGNYAKLGTAAFGVDAYVDGSLEVAVHGVNNAFNGVAGWFQGRTITEVLEITGGADFAENFTVGGEFQPGMVVCIDSERAGALRVSGKAYDKCVAGITSGAGGVKPGMRMGQDGTLADGDVPVALAGRVYCLCDASFGAIQPGDLLTTSDTPGHAKKVLDHARAQGAIIGKAMTSLDSGQGLVLVLVTLQ